MKIFYQEGDVPGIGNFLTLIQADVIISSTVKFTVSQNKNWFSFQKMNLISIDYHTAGLIVKVMQ